ncbi:MAG: ankyrin repeat domain-containing protein [Bacteroidales bacterium]|nr:ankyrin repeat domain-containing protein [Bacteroidales bacterium]
MFRTETETIFVYMVTRLNRLYFSLLIILFGSSAFAQPDSLAIDSIDQRIRTILEVYNEQVLFVDTSDYLTNESYADDINLQLAASKGACNEILRLYVKGADVNNFVGKTATPLHYAVSSGEKKAVEILLLLGAQTDKHDMYGNTPLTSAVRAQDLEMAELLIRYGALPDAADRSRSTPLHHSSALGYFYITDMLLYYDARTELHDVEGNTPLMTGVGFGYYEIADILLQSGADPNTPDKRGFTPLMTAAQNGDTLMMRLLLNAGANLYAINHEGIDALGCAVLYGHKEAAEFLLDAGNRWNYNGRENSDPVNLARNYGRSELLQMMTERGMEGKKEFALEEFSVSAGGMFTNHYPMAFASISLTEPGLKGGITFGAAFSPASQRMLTEGDNDIIYQYKVKSSVIYAGVFREFLLNNPAMGYRWSFVPSIMAGYRFYSLYEGTNTRPDDKFCIIPSAEITWSMRRFTLGSGLTYLNTPFYKVSPLWITIKASYTLTRDSRSITGKKIRLYRYE